MSSPKACKRNQKLFSALLVFFCAHSAHAWTPGAEYTNQPGLSPINVKSAYDQGFSGSGVKIGIVDSGINANHVEFTNAIAAAMGWQRSGTDLLTADNWVSTTGTSNFSTFINDTQADGTTVDGHGTFVSSIAAARLDGNGRDGNMMGVAYNASLVIGKRIFDQCAKSDGVCIKESDGSEKVLAKGLNDKQTAATIDYVSSQGVKVINNSWGVNPEWGVTMAQEATNYIANNPLTVAALKRAQDRGAVIVFAAGNESIGWPGAPATLPSVDASVQSKGGWIVVAATTNRGIDPNTKQIEMAQYRVTTLESPTVGTDYYTNYCGDARNYCISAPGGYDNSTDTLKTDKGMHGASSTTTSYENGNGTSYAAPVVSGAVALVAEKYPWMSSKNLGVTILTTGTTASAPSLIWGRGLLDVSKAINGPGIFEEDFEANLDKQAYSSTFSNIISGGYGIRKLGEGTLTLTGTNTFTGNTYLNGGTLAVSAQNNLGNTSSALQFNGGTLKFAGDFALTRDLTIGSSGGAVDINGYTKTQTFNISGTGQFGVKGGGTFTLDRTNSQTGGLAIGSATDASITTVVASNNNNLGAAGSKITLDQGKLTLASGFNSSLTSNQFNRPLYVGLSDGTIDTSAFGTTALSFTGGRLGSSVSGDTAGVLKFIGTPFTMGSNLQLDAFWGANLTVPDGMTLSGRGGADTGYKITFLAGSKDQPGHSPGVQESYGSMEFLADSELDIEIDGTGSGDGAGNYDRIVLLDAMSTFTAGGQLYTSLRDISDGNNNYTPSLGQGFRIVTAPGGVTGSFEGLTQPDSGLAAGTRLDTVYGATSLDLYATPASYSNIAAAGVATNNNRQQVGVILEDIRPDAGIRESSATRKYLFDSLAPQTTSSLPVALDQLAGVGYGQLIGMNFENSKFLANQIGSTVAQQRRSEPKLPGSGQNPEQLTSAPPEEMWGSALGRIANWRGDGVGHDTSDVLSGAMGGVQKRFTPQSLAGIALAYAYSNPSIADNLGNGPMQNLQLMGYLSHAKDTGFYVQGLLGGGGGSINASRNITMMNTSYTTVINTANIAGSVLAGWAVEGAEKIRYEAGVGVNYQGMYQSGFTDSGSQSGYALSTQAGNAQSLMPSMSATASIPFQARQIDWTGYGLVNLGYETADNTITMQSNFLGTPISVESGSIGRTHLNLGVGVAGRLGKETKIALDVAYQSAQNWNAVAAYLSLNVGF